MTKLVEKSKRIRRNTLKTVGPLYVNPKYKRQGYVTRWVNDLDGNLERFIDLGYEPVQRDVETGDNKASTTHRLGSVETKSVGNGITAVLCEIPEEIYKEHQEEKEDRVAEIDRALGRTGIPTQYGEIDLGNKVIK